MTRPIPPTGRTRAVRPCTVGTRARAVRTALAVGASLALTGVAFAAPPAGAQTPRPAVRLTSATHADLGAAYLARQLGDRGYLRTATGRPDASDTAQAVLALTATGTQRTAATRALRWLEAHVRTETTTAGSLGGQVYDPGALAFLILDAHALGADPHRFGGVDLVARLLRSERADGLFGRAAPTYDGAYRQGLALAALAAAGVRGTPAVTRAVAWLRTQQCASGGWEAYRTSVTTACGRPDPAAYSGPDTNSTSLAVEGLVAQGVHPIHRPRGFFIGTQNRDGGWGYYGGASDADSTALVRQALVALHIAHLATWTRRGGTPEAVLARDQLASGAEFYQRAAGTSANLLATEQAVPALAQVAFPVPARP